MDFNKLNMTEKANAGATMQVMHPASKMPLEGCTITLLGLDSTKFKQKKAETRKKIAITDKTTAENLDHESMNTRISLTMAWTGIEENGEIVECIPEKVRYIYEKYSWLAEQVDVFISDRANFF